MCRLLGVIANKPVDLEFSLRRFKKLATWNPDGWGIGWYQKGKSRVFKEGISAVESNKFPILSREVRSNIIIAHVRKGTEGEPSEKNSHPFGSQNWIFAHNGSINKECLLSYLSEEEKSELKGEVDSKVYFYWLLQCIGESKDVVKGIRKAINKIIESDYTGLNFLLSDGNSLYAFRYSKDSRNYYSLYKLRREPSTLEPVEYLSEETGLLIRSKSLKGEKAVLVSSEKLTEDEEWEEIGFGNLLVVNSDLTAEEVKII